MRQSSQHKKHLFIIDFACFTTLWAISFITREFRYGGSIHLLYFLFFLTSWDLVYENARFTLNYYILPYKVIILTTFLLFIYLGGIRHFNAMFIVLIINTTWLTLTSLYRYQLNFFTKPKFQAATTPDTTNQTIPSPRINYTPLPPLNENNTFTTTPNIQNIDVILVNPQTEYPTPYQHLFMEAQVKGIPILPIAKLNEEINGYIELNNLTHVWSQGQIARNQFYLHLKKAIDWCLLALTLPATLPLATLTATAIRMTSGKPIIFSQTRIGRGGKPFTLYKFRTMTNTHANEYETQKNDQRITKLGHFLRKTRLDEIPQLWNIAKGDMSFIGPRPEWIKTAETFDDAIPVYHLRQIVRPGLTGWAQVNQGHATGIKENYKKLQYDIFYIKNLSLWLDLHICLKTIKTIFFGIGAK